MAISEDKISELDKRLADLALDNFDKFCQMMGLDKTRAYVCLLKSKGNSLRTIQKMLDIPKSTVGRICDKCPE